MGAAGWTEIAIYVLLLTAITPVLGAYMTRVYGDRRGRPPHGAAVRER
jgi:K+-transporting ATPase A subunit